MSTLWRSGPVNSLNDAAKYRASAHRFRRWGQDERAGLKEIARASVGLGDFPLSGRRLRDDHVRADELDIGADAAAAAEQISAQGVIRAQEQAFGRDDAASAYSYAAPALHEIFPSPEVFMTMVQRGYGPVYRHKSFEFGEGRVADGKIAQAVRIIDAENRLCHRFVMYVAALQLLGDGVHVAEAALELSGLEYG